jgi:hypothetical protein
VGSGEGREPLLEFVMIHGVSLRHPVPPCKPGTRSSALHDPAPILALVVTPA